MKLTTGALVFTLAMGCATAVPSLAQDPDHRGDQPQAQDQNRDRDQRSDQDRAQDQNRDRDKDQRADQDRDRRNTSDNDSAYYGNKHFQQGWKDGLKHKRSNRNFKDDDDRRAYEAGYAHGDRGEKWQNQPDRDRDRDRR